MISAILEEKIQTFKDSTQKAIRFNIELLDLVEGYDSEYHKFLSTNMVFVDYVQLDNEVPYYLAFIDSIENADYLKQNMKGLFKPLCDLIDQGKCRIRTKVQIAGEYFEDVLAIKSILLAYLTRKQSDEFAEMAKKRLEEEKAVGLDTILTKKSHYAQNNLLTRSAFSENLTVVQKKLLNYFIFKFQYKCKEDLFGESYFTVTKQELVNCGCGSNQTAIMKSLKDLMENTTMKIQYNDSWSIYNMFSSFQGSTINNEIKVRFTPEMSALINKVGVSRNYTLLSLNSINSIKRYSSMRMYELCSQYRNANSPIIYITDDDLRAMLNCKDKYLDPHDFKKRVLKDAEKELKELSEKGVIDMCFECKEAESVKMDWQFKYKKVTKWALIIKRNENFEKTYISHDGKKKKMDSAYMVLHQIIETKLSDELSKDQKEEYMAFVKGLTTNEIDALVHDLQIEMYFSGNKNKLETFEIILRKYGFREGGSIPVQ